LTPCAIGRRPVSVPASIDVLEDPELRDLFETFWTAGKFAAADRMKLFKLGGNS
jgi:hypothetical protein